MKRYLGLLLLVSLAFLTGCSGKPKGRYRMAFMPKLVAIPYFKACERGAREAAQELGIDLTYDGSTKDDANAQIAMLSQWVESGEYDCIAVACNEPKRIADILKRAQEKGITVVTYDADAVGGREFFVNQATYDSVAQEMVDAMAEELGPGGGKVAILTSSIQAPNQRQWADRMYAYARKKYPKIQLLPETEHGENRTLGITRAKTLIDKNKDELKGIIGLTSVAVPAAAEAVRQKVREGQIKKGQVKVVGVSTPKDMRDYVHDGTVNTVVLWNPIDLGYLTVYVADWVREKKMPKQGTIEKIGRLRDIKVKDGEVILGKPVRFTRDNIDKFDF
jgi:rhamnose transport system substrate-binding protein